MPRESHALAPEEPTRRPAPRWWQRALPVTGLALLLTSLVVVLGQSDEQIRLSTTRQEQPFVELALTRSPLQLCGARRPLLRFSVVSHLPAAETLRFTVAADPALAGQKRFARRAAVQIAPGATRSLRTRLVAPARGAYDVAVRIQDRPEALRVHCAATRPGAKAAKKGAGR
jgi:hypothetical protein